MTVRDAITRLDLEALSLPDGDREIRGGYCGDLLSWVMTRLQSDEAWVTIMNNVNVIAVASLSDAACVILTENAEVEEAVIDRARERGVNLLRSDQSSFEICAQLGELTHA
ncbi:MAG: hypothetical protein IJ009_05545 [Clostridia bacterium]|nr:hypothetical protein [Clostridia bacterium]